MPKAYPTRHFSVKAPRAVDIAALPEINAGWPGRPGMQVQRIDARAVRRAVVGIWWKPWTWRLGTVWDVIVTYEATTFICDKCGRIGECQPEAEALAELHEEFGNVDPADCVVVCDYCWAEVRPRE